MNELELLENIQQKEKELLNLNIEYEKVKEEKEKKVLKNKGFERTLFLLNQEFESSSSRTPQYLKAHRYFKKDFIDVLKPFCKDILIHKPNHFDITGFFELNDGRIYYFSIGDLRWDKTFLIRTAKDFKDYTGGSNNYIDLNNNFVENLLKYIK